MTSLMSLADVAKDSDRPSLTTEPALCCSMPCQAIRSFQSSTAEQELENKSESILSFKEVSLQIGEMDFQADEVCPPPPPPPQHTHTPLSRDPCKCLSQQTLLVPPPPLTHPCLTGSA